MIFLSIFLLALLCLKFEVGKHQDFDVLWASAALIAGLALFLLVIIMICGQCDTSFFQEHTELSMRNAMAETMSEREFTLFQEEVIDHNKRLIGYYVKVKNPWTNWFYQKKLLVLRTIPLKIYHKQPVLPKY